MEAGTDASTEGQPVAEEPTGTTSAGTEGGTGQSATAGQTTGNGTGSEESFYTADMERINSDPDLSAAYKSMQSAFSKRTKALKDSQSKIEAYDKFASNPVESMRELASQYGYQVVQGPQDEGAQQQKFESWDDVFSHAKKEVLKELEPLLGEVKDLRKQNIEQFLDQNHGDWREYETEMMGLLKEHPTLVNQPSLLYRMAVPEEVQTARAQKAALARVQGDVSGSRVSGQSQTTRQASEKPTGPLTFQQAADFAKAEVKRRGLSRPVE